jgi:hypothetical protein
MNWRGDTKDIGAAVVDAVLNGHSLDTSHAGRGRHSPANSDREGFFWCKRIFSFQNYKNVVSSAMLD